MNYETITFQMGGHTAMIAIFSKIKMNAKQVWGAVIFVILSSVAQMLAPALVSTMLNDGVNNSDYTFLIGLTAAIVALCVFAFFASLISTKLSGKLTTKFCADLRKTFFHKVKSFSSAEIDKFGTASLITRNTTDITTIQNFLSMLFKLGMMGPLMAIAGVVMCVAYSGRVAVVLAIAVPVMLIILVALLIAASRYSTKLREIIDRINRLFLEAIEGVRVIRAFNKQQHEIGRFKAINEESSQVSGKSIALSVAMYPVVTAIAGIASVAAASVGTPLIRYGVMDVSALIAVIQYINIVLIAIILTLNVAALFPDASACFKRVNEVLDTAVTIADAESETPAKTCKGTVEFRNVTFAYPNADEPVIKGISFVSKPGETTAIIGRTGCGKSSIVKLIPRLYDALFGEVLIDGVNVKDYKLDELRDLIGYVPQKNVLFSGDIAGNLNWGNKNGTEADWKEACRIACADEFVEKKPEGYHAPVAQGGTNFSGGQRQRLAIARAVMKKPEVYVFDDSFSALDMKTDKQLRQNLKGSMGEATMIVVAQRVNTIMDATRILVLENGEVAGMGTHRELLRSCTLYREIAEIQLGEEEVKRELQSV